MFWTGICGREWEEEWCEEDHLELEQWKIESTLYCLLVYDSVAIGVWLRDADGMKSCRWVEWKRWTLRDQFRNHFGSFWCEAGSHGGLCSHMDTYGIFVTEDVLWSLNIWENPRCPLCTRILNAHGSWFTRRPLAAHRACKGPIWLRQTVQAQLQVGRAGLESNKNRCLTTSRIYTAL